MFVPCINSIKALFIIPTDEHNYKIIGISKQLVGILIVLVFL